MSVALLEGSEAIADAMVAAGCRFFSGYPMTPFTEVLEHMAVKLPEVGGTCMNAESELEAVGMAWGAAATGTPSATGSTGQGLSLMQESLSEAALARIPLVVLNMARAQGDYWQATHGPGHGDSRMPVLAPMDVPEAITLTQLAFRLAFEWRNPVLVFGDYYLAHTASSVEMAPLETAPLRADEWALTGATSGTGNARLVSPLGTGEHGAESSYADHLVACAHATEVMLAGIEPLAETGFCDDAEVVVVAFGTPAKYVRAAVSRLRTEGVRIGYVRPITLLPFPSEILANAVHGARAVAVYENNQGQMVDDVRLALAGSAPVQFIGRLSLDSSGFGIAPDLEGDYVRDRLLKVLDVEVMDG